MRQNRAYTIESLAKLQEFAQLVEAKISEPLNIKKDPEEDSIHLSTENQELHLQVFPVLKEDITEFYKVDVVRQTDEFEAILNEVLDISRSTPRKTSRSFTFLTKFYEKIRFHKK